MMRSLVTAALWLLGLHAACAADTSPAHPAPQSAEAVRARASAASESSPASHVSSDAAATAENQAAASAALKANADRAQPSAAAARPKRTGDRLDLDPTVVTGNRELPKVLYIVPWKKGELGDLPSQPFNTLLDEALTPVDRDVFRREVTYYGAVSAGANSSAAPASSQAAGPEK